MPRSLIFLGLFVTTLALLPLAALDRSRSVKSESPRIQVVYDMDQQAYSRSQSASTFFEDGRAMRPHVAGTVARGDLREGDAYWRGQSGEVWVEAFPIEVDARFVRRGRDRYDVFCSPCHGGTDNDGL